MKLVAEKQKTINTKLLYCFITHQSQLSQDQTDIKLMCDQHDIKDYLIVCGGYSETSLIDNILYLNCNDTYEGLPNKIHNLYKYLYYNHDKKYDFYLKLDRLCKIKKPILNIYSIDYGGIVNASDVGSRTYHVGKCSTNSIWNDKIYKGKYTPWCLGGSGYFLSRKSLKIIADNPPNDDYDIYEDVYVALTLKNKGRINPTMIRNLSDYIVDESQ